MKKRILVFSMSSLLAVGGMSLALAQEQPKPEKDTVNIDTDAKPAFYYNIEDEQPAGKSQGKGSAGTILLIAGAVVVAGAGAFFFLKKKK